MSQRRILLHDVDAAGVVFYARALAIAHEEYELSMAQAGLALDRIIREGRLALPVVHAEADFTHPLRHGDLVDIHVSLDQVGERSVRIAITLETQGRLAVRVLQVHACLDPAVGRAVAVSAELRAALQRLGTMDG